uniref:Uncharacterized protein n=1 Tax=Anguilla anguilla TaxID=7936 RepID=A0A0E9VI16_ANGAN
MSSLLAHVRSNYFCYHCAGTSLGCLYISKPRAAFLRI